MKENQRVRLTKKMLRESLVGLLAEKSIHKISVRELCDRAEINRTTFYKYYGSQYDLFKDMENEVLTKIELYLSADHEQAADDEQRLAGILFYFDENLELCRLLINNTVDSVFFEKLISLTMIRRLLGEQLVEGYANGDSEYVYQFVVNGGFNLVKRWINKEKREPPEAIAGLLIKTVYKIFA